MTASRIKSGILVALLALLAIPVAAETPAAEAPPAPAPAVAPATPPPDGREASFLPPPGMPEPLVPQPLGAATTGAPASAAAAAKDTTSSSAEFPFPLVPVFPTAATTTAAPAVSAAPVAPAAPATPLSPTTTATESASIIGNPVESSELKTIDSDTVGLLTSESGGLGAAMWKDTPRELVERLLPALTLPTASPALNDLARRFLLTTANAPNGPNGTGDTLVAMRIKKLIALGNAAKAWDLAQMAKPGQIDDATLRTTIEAALVSPASRDVCLRLPDIVHAHDGPEWQESLVTCQLRDGNKDQAQLGLEVLHAQNVKDETFFGLAEHNIIGGVKSLPRQLTPLKPVPLALLRIIDKPLPTEVYAHPDAAVVPELLRAAARSEDVRLNLAERSAAHGIIDAAQLGEVYGSISFTPEAIAAALTSSETKAHLRALLYQAAKAEKTPRVRLDECVKFLQSLDADNQNGAMAQLLAGMTGDVPASGDYAGHAPDIALIFIMAGKTREAQAWLAVAHAAGTPEIAGQLQNMWPLIVLSGIETDSDYGQNLSKWLDAVLKDDDHAEREKAGTMLMLFDAAGYAVPESAWGRVIDVPDGTKRILPPPVLLLERLRLASDAGRRGETVLLALASFGGKDGDFPLLPSIETIRALRLVGLKTDALALARETATRLLAPPETAGKP